MNKPKKYKQTKPTTKSVLFSKMKNVYKVQTLVFSLLCLTNTRQCLRKFIEYEPEGMGSPCTVVERIKKYTPLSLVVV